MHPTPDDGTGALLRLVGCGVLGGAVAVGAALYAFSRVGRPSSVAWSQQDRASAALAITAPPPAAALRGVTVQRPPEEPERAISLPEGFTAELVYAVPREQGSWVSLTVDGAGRLIASAQGGGLYRVRPMAVGENFDRTTVEPIDSPAGAAQGLCVVDGDLYCVVAAGRAEGPGLYRLRDSDGDDRFDQTVRLRALTEGGEHGPHGIVAGPDGMLYIVGGNHCPPPQPERSLVPRVWSEDHLLPRLWDANGHAVGILAPGGWICRTDRDGSSFELVAIGMRNAYDLAFDRDGRLFTYDSDLEWDMGAPWYRPTRICEVASGADFGWRSGTGKWPTHFADSLPGVLDLGPGSPTGLVFGHDTAFPTPWRDALFALDWTFGTIRAIRFEPDGASVRASAETFMTGEPLPVADAAANPADGSLYVVLGGRGVPSAIYRVRWTGGGDDGGRSAAARAQPATPATPATPALARRRSMEALHSPSAPAEAIATIWPLLDDDDRFVRHAARIALEHQPPQRWLDRIAGERDAGRAIAAVIAAARTASPGQAAGSGAQPPAIDPAQARQLSDRLHAALDAIDWESLDQRHRLDLLRARALCLIRLGPANDELRRSLCRRLEPLFPSGDDAMDRELCDLLVFCGSPLVVSRAVALMERRDAAAAETIDTTLLSRSHAYGDAILRMAANQPQRQQIHYALSLRNATRGWTLDLRRRYFTWFDSARRTSGGMSFAGFLDNIRKDALAHVPEAERPAIERLATGSAGFVEVPDRPVAAGPGRSWTTDEVAALAAEAGSGRDFEQGRRMFAAALCVDCHRLAGEGRLGGPELTTVASRFGPRDIAEAIVEPSRVVSDQHQFTEFRLTDDRVVIGRVVGRDGGRVKFFQNLLAPDAVEEIAEAEIVAHAPSMISPMPANLLDRLNAEEVKDLLAYMLAGGDPRSDRFQGGVRSRTGALEAGSGGLLGNEESGTQMKD